MTTSADFESALASNLRTFAALNAEQARQDALRIAARIVRLVGCKDYRVLDLVEVLDMIDDVDTNDIPPNESTALKTPTSSLRRNGLKMELFTTSPWRLQQWATGGMLIMPPATPAI